ncbi:MAG: CxxxxCH/CxxCH domain-containing protein [Bacteroidetes bacterium]|nr:CxxxxCH/CxxCH domain-containing protein [Bacteroidota bacterium]
MKKQISLFAVIVFASLFLNACSKLQQENPPTQPTASIHGEGFANPVSSNSHVKYIQGHNWDIQACKACHGANYAGGTSQKSCLTCHSKRNGPENCTTCHGGVNPAPPTDLAGNINRSAHGVGAHQVHISYGYSCSTCHISPSKVTSPGHLDGVKGAEIHFDTTGYFATNPSYNFSDNKCSNIYCHGNFQNGNQSNKVLWTDTTGNGALCGTCHGDITRSDKEDRARPKTVEEGGTHPNRVDGKTVLQCYQCHVHVVDANLNFVNKSLHLNGKVDF